LLFVYRYLNSAKVGDRIVINSETVKLGKNLAFLKVTLSRKDDNIILARGSHTKFVGWFEIFGTSCKIDVFVIQIVYLIYFSFIVKNQNCYIFILVVWLLYCLL